jgi:hypothetical protein
MTERPGGLTGLGGVAFRTVQPGEWRTVGSCLVKFIVDDDGPRAGVLWAPGRDRVGQHPGIPHVRLMADLHLCDRRLGSAMTWRGLSAGRPFIRAVGSLVLLMSLLGAKLGANAGRRRATSGHIGPESRQLNGTPGDSWPWTATSPGQSRRRCVLHAAARLVRGGRRRTLKIAATWPWAEENVTAWQRVQAIPHPT